MGPDDFGGSDEGSHYMAQERVHGDATPEEFNAAEQSGEPLTACIDCGAIGRARFAHFHECSPTDPAPAPTMRAGVETVAPDGSRHIGLPHDSAGRKTYPLQTGCYDYFPAALAEVAFASFVGNEKHNPGEPLHHARGKSMDHADCQARHAQDRGTFDRVELPDGRVFYVRHSAWKAWRALAELQEECEAAGAPLARGAWEAGK